MIDRQKNLTLPEAKERKKGTEVVKESVLYPLAYRIDKILPRELPKYPPNIEKAAEFLRRLSTAPVSQEDIKRMEDPFSFLGNCLDVIIINSRWRTSSSDALLFESRKENQKDESLKFSIDVVLHPLELGTLIKAFHFLSSAVEQDPKWFKEVLSHSGQKIHFSEEYSYLLLLETMNKLGILGNESFAPLVNFLRHKVVHHPLCSTLERVQSEYSSSVVNDSSFWETAYANQEIVRFPDPAAVSLTRRSVAHKQYQLRQNTLGRAVKNVHVLGQNPREVIEHYSSKFQEKRALEKEQEITMMHEIKAWREALLPIVEELSIDDELEEDLEKYLRKAIAILAAHFIQREQHSPDRDLSRKAQTLLPSLFDGSTDANYESQIKNFLESTISSKDPIILWLEAFRNTQKRQTMVRSIKRDPKRFIDLEKLILHQLSKYGLLQKKGEKEIFFRASSSVDDTVLLELLPQLVKELSNLASYFTEVKEADTSLWFKSLTNRFFSDVTKIQKSTSPVTELLTPRHLSQLAYQSAVDRLEQLAPTVQRKIDQSLIHLHLRMGKYAQKLNQSWFGGERTQSNSGATALYEKYIGEKTGLESVLSQETQKKQLAQRGVLLFSKERRKEMDDLPMWSDSFMDDEIEKLLDDTENFYLSEDYTISVEELPTLLKKYHFDMVYLVELPEGYTKAPLFTDHTFSGSWKLGNDNGKVQWVIGVKKKKMTSYSAGVRSGSFNTLLNIPYSFKESFNYSNLQQEAEKLKDDPYLYQVVKDVIAELRFTFLDDKREVSRVIKKHILKLEEYFKVKRFYDLRELPQEQIENPLLFAAQHPEIGLRCYDAALTVKSFLNMFGVRASVLRAEVPYFYDGGIFANGIEHAVCVGVLPDGEVLEIDFTPPITFKTPTKVQVSCAKLIPVTYQEFSTWFEKKKLFNTELLNRKKLLMFAVGALFTGTVAQSSVVDKGADHLLPSISHISGESTVEMDWMDGENQSEGSITSNVATPDRKNAGIENIEEDISPEDKQEDNEDDEKFLDQLSSFLHTSDFSKIPFLELLGALGITTAATGGFLKLYTHLEEGRKKRIWFSYKTFIEQHFSPTEQIVMQSVLYPMKGNKNTNRTELKRVMKMLHEFEIEAAAPLLELIAFLLNEDSARSKAFKEKFIEFSGQADFVNLYDLVARESVNYVPKKELAKKWYRRLLSRKNPTLIALQKRGREQQKAAPDQQSYNEPQSSQTSENARHFDLFCRSIGVMEMVMELRKTFDLDLQVAQMLKEAESVSLKQDEIKMDEDLGHIPQELQDFARKSRRDVTWNILNTLYQMERSLEKGAIELFTREELKKIEEQAKSLMW